MKPLKTQPTIVKRLRLQLMLTIQCLASALAVAHTDHHYIYLANGHVEAYPHEHVKALNATATAYTLTLISDSVVTWTASEVDSVSDIAPEYPQFTEFDFNDNLNEQLTNDVYGTIACGRVTATVAAIGKWLTPSFKLSDRAAVVYVDGALQTSGTSRLRFDDEVTYTVGYPQHRRLAVEKISDEVWSNPDITARELALTADMLSTNAPSGRNEGLDKLVDGLPATYFHSTWTGDPLYDKLPESEYPYISVALTKPISALQFYYQTRIDSNNRNPYAFKVYASADNATWHEVAYLDESDGIPTIGPGVEYTSPVIKADGAYRYWKFEQTACSYKNYLVLSTFRLYEVDTTVSEPELIAPARYAYRMVPLGREVPIDVTWLTDEATAVPRIDIDIDGGQMVSSKEYYLDALITIQGNGVWADFQSPVQIKGRGNSSWSGNPYAKNPYRLKFASSVKPFGLTKGKNWNLIAQAQGGSMMSNPMAMKAARMVGAAGANDVIPVDLYMNGEYRGSYIFTQKTGLANNSIDLDDESAAAFLELDTYYDETYRFFSDKYRLPVNVKEPDFAEGETVIDMEQLKRDFNRFETSLYEDTHFERLIDIDMLVRFMLVNELVYNSEINHPKSTFLYKEDLGRLGSPYVFGPVWDFDWSYGYESNRQYCTTSPTDELFGILTSGKGNKFFTALWQKSDLIKRRYYALWKDFVENHLEEYIDYADDYLAYANSSFINNTSIWGDGGNYATVAENMKTWLRARAHHILQSLTPYDLNAPVDYPYGDINADNTIDDTDRELLLAELFSDAHSSALLDQADIDATGQLTISDVAWLNDMIADEAKGTPALSAQEKHTPSAATSTWALSLTKADGLPGTFNGYSYEYTSPIITAPSPIKKLRLTVTDSNTGDSGSGYICFAIAEFYLYDAQGNAVALTAKDFTTNAQEPKEGPLADIVDGDMFTYFHSTWSEAAEAEHYIEVTLPEPMSEFTISYLSRNERTVPTAITLTEGVANDNDGGDGDILSPDGIGVQVVETQPGMEWQLTLSLDKWQPYTAFQMDMILPEGINIFDAETDLVPEACLEAHTLIGDYNSEGDFRILTHSPANANIGDTGTALFTLLLTADRTLTPGSHPLTIEDIRMVTGAGFELSMSEITVPIHISETAIDSPTNTAYRISYFTVEGKPLAAPRPGIVICRKVYTDGRVETIKRMY